MTVELLTVNVFGSIVVTINLNALPYLMFSMCNIYLDSK